MNSLPLNPSEATKKRNPHLYRRQIDSGLVAPAFESSKAKRIRQDSKPLMNKLESEWFAILNAQFLNCPRPRAQAKKYRLGNGIWYRPDVTASSWPVDGDCARETAWECKGPHAWQSGIQPLKVAASVWPEVRWILVWKGQSGVWEQQEILP